MEKRESTKLEFSKENVKEVDSMREWQRPELFLLDIEKGTLFSSSNFGSDTIGYS